MNRNRDKNKTWLETFQWLVAESASWSDDGEKRD